MFGRYLAKRWGVPNKNHLRLPLLTLLNGLIILLVSHHTPFFAHDVSPPLVSCSSAGRWWKHGTNIATPAASCAPTVTSTSNRRVTSSWRGSCTVRLTLALEWDHRRDTTSSPPFPPRSFPSLRGHTHTHKQTHTHTNKHKQTHLASTPTSCVYLHFDVSSVCHNVWLIIHFSPDVLTQ